MSLKIRLLLVVVVVAGFGVFEGVKHLHRASEVSGLKPQLDSYLATPTGSSSAAHPRLAGGKVVCVCENEHAFDESHYFLDDAQRATKPDEVAAIVQVTRREEVVGNYPSVGGDAILLWADVNVIDKATGQLIAQHTFRGGEPPQTKRRNESGKGSAPVQDIVDWLKTI